jgi:hypothetical protein
MGFKQVCVLQCRSVRAAARYWAAESASSMALRVPIGPFGADSRRDRKPEAPAPSRYSPTMFSAVGGRGAAAARCLQGGLCMGHPEPPAAALPAPHWPQHPTPSTLQALRTKVLAMWPGGALQPPCGALSLVVSEYAPFAVGRAVLAPFLKFRLQEFEIAPDQKNYNTYEA